MLCVRKDAVRQVPNSSHSGKWSETRNDIDVWVRLVSVPNPVDVNASNNGLPCLSTADSTRLDTHMPITG